MEKMNNYFTYTAILIGMVIILLPYPFAINRLMVALAGLGTLAFFVLWNRWAPKNLEARTKNFFEAVVGIIAISIIVHYSGGTDSYFVFLYFLPALNVAANLGRSLTFWFVGIAYGFILIQGLADIETSAGLSALSVAAFHLWSLGIVTAYGRLLAKEISLAKEREEKIRVEQIEEVSKLKDEFVFIISHELRSPITAIRGYLELVMTDPASKKNDDFESVVSKAFYTSNKLANLVSLLLEISRLETGKIKFYIQKVNLREAVDATMHGLSTDAQSKHINIIVEIPENYEVYIDNERLIEILTIMIENAVRYTPEFGKVRISASRNLGGVNLSIEDDGIGIPNDIRQHLFDKYYEFKTGGDKEIKGLGLGLYVTKKLLKAMRGEIRVKSALGKGTTFTLSLPISAY